MIRSIIQIVPRRTDQPDGVGDYATMLAHAIFDRAAWISTFVSGTPVEMEAPLRDAWLTVPVTVRRGKCLASQLADHCKKSKTLAVIIHISGYGYQKRGAPVWLLNGLRAWRKQHPNICLIGIFHELFATGHVWRSSFWLSCAQSYITRELWRLCDRGFATNHAYFNQLIAWRPAMRDRLKIMPVFSSVGEPDELVPFRRRANNMVVFGRPGTERGIYYGPDSRKSIAMVQKLGIEKIIDIGMRGLSPPVSFGNTQVTALGRLPPSVVSEHLLKCRFGLINYDLPRLGKSTVFAAYAAHGVIPVSIQSGPELADGLKVGKHLLQWPLEQVPTDLTKMQVYLRDWYQEHSIVSQAEVIIDWCLLDVT